MRIVTKLGAGIVLMFSLACQQQATLVGTVQHGELKTTNPYYLKYRFVGLDVKTFDAAVKLVLHDANFFPHELMKLASECHYGYCYIEELEEELGTLYVKNLSANTPIEAVTVNYQFIDEDTVLFGDNAYGIPYKNRWEGKLSFGSISPLNWERACCGEMKFIDGQRESNNTECSGGKLKDLTAEEWHELTGR